MVDTSLAPFYHGVASGDPTPNAVIIWTRVTPDVDGTVSGTWHVALDTNFTNVVQSGTFTTDSTKDYTVKIDVTGLLPNTWYFYEFNALGKNSLTGRTKTAPVGGSSQLRFAFVSCANYPTGFFNIYDRIKDRNDIDAVLHLGDYIYEGGGTSTGPRNDLQPTHEIIKLADYRQRYSSYRLDVSTRRVQQQYAMMAVWDDHETANNSWSGGAENHTPAKDKAHGVKEKQQGNRHMMSGCQSDYRKREIQIRYSEKSVTETAQIFMLDTRLYDRSIQGGNATDTNRHIAGTQQLQWLK